MAVGPSFVSCKDDFVKVRFFLVRRRPSLPRKTSLNSSTNLPRVSWNQELCNLFTWHVPAGWIPSVKLYEIQQWEFNLGFLFIMQDNDMMMGFITPKIQLQQKNMRFSIASKTFTAQVAWQPWVAALVACWRCDFWGPALIWWLRCLLHHWIKMRGKRQKKKSEISWVKRRLAGYELFNWLIHPNLLGMTEKICSCEKGWKRMNIQHLVAWTQWTLDASENI